MTNTDPMLRHVISESLRPDGPEDIHVTLLTAAGYVTGHISHRAQFLVDIADRKDWDKPGRTENESDPVAPRPTAAPPASEIKYVYLSDVTVRPVELNKPLMWSGVPMAVHLDHVIGWTLGGMEVMNNGGWEMMQRAGMEPDYKDDESGNLAQVLQSAAEWSGISPTPEWAKLSD